MKTCFIRILLVLSLSLPMAIGTPLSLSQNVGLGTTAPLGKFHINGTGNTSQLIMDAYSAQTNSNPLVRLRKSNGADVLWIHSDHQTNTFIGVGAGVSNLPFETNATGNTFIGRGSGLYNLSGYFNTAVGQYSNSQNTNGYANTSLGINSLNTGNYNTAFGQNALYLNSGNYNTGFGERTLLATQNSNFNVAVGSRSGWFYNNGWNNAFAGFEADASIPGIYNVVAAGSYTYCTDVNQARFGNFNTESIGGYASWTNISDGRFKKDVRENVIGLEFIRRLRPVMYQLDISGILDFMMAERDNEMKEEMKLALAGKEEITRSGFIAQEVEAAAQSVGFQFNGVDAPVNDKSFYGLRYGLFVVPLVKSVQELDQHIEILMKQEALKSQLKNDLEEMRKNIELLKASAK